MAKDPKNFTGEDVKRLLDSEERRLRSSAGWKLTGHFALVVAGSVALIGCLAALVFQGFR
ncbi:hypothetical protein ABL850_15495 [Variovorax paradoxus]|jgi:hypothetical protein|uniref:hypothetical protein n=1 Tax=Variovorax paradoxus TaxID=34073 RepID=UPI0004112D7C